VCISTVIIINERPTVACRLDIHEDEESNSITAKLELPGLKSEDISIEVEEGHLTVSGEFPKENPHSENGYSIRERRPGKFWRTIQIPGGVKPGEVKAKMEHGLLTITFPRVVVVPEQPQRIVVS
ncbi:hypothetical protein ID866_13116, partial [Astraeus odoratus]